MQVLIFHNVTTWADLAAAGDTGATEDIARDKNNAKGLAIFRRMPPGDKAPIEPGDKLRFVGELDLQAPDRGTDTTLVAAHAAFTAGNSPYEGDPGVTQYRTWNVRSLSVGDVVVVRHHAEPRAYACAAFGWDPINADLAAYEVDVSRAPRNQAGPWQKWIKRPTDHVVTGSEGVWC